MGFLIVICTIVIIGAVVLLVGAPIRDTMNPQALPGEGQGADGTAPDGRGSGPGRDELEAAREAKYREIRDAELDFRTGKLSPEDYGLIDTDLRREALQILDRLEGLKGGGTESGHTDAERPAD